MRDADQITPGRCLWSKVFEYYLNWIKVWKLLKTLLSLWIFWKSCSLLKLLETLWLSSEAGMLSASDRGLCLFRTLLYKYGLLLSVIHARDVTIVIKLKYYNISRSSIDFLITISTTTIFRMISTNIQIYARDVRLWCDHWFFFKTPLH